MVKYARSMLALFVLSFGYTVLSACGDAAAGSGVSQSDFDALAARVEELEAQQHRVISSTAGGAMNAKALDAGLEAIGTLMSFDGPPSVATTVNVRSALGYLFAASLDTGEVQGPGANVGGIVRFVSADCSGQAFVGAGDIGAYAARQGTVFRIEQQDGSDVFYAVIAGTDALDPATYGSFYAWGSGCTTQDAVLPAFPTVINDPVTTGVDNAPVAVSVTVG